MSDFARVRVGFEVSEASDYSAPYEDFSITDAITPDEVSNQTKVECDTGGTTVDITNFASIDYLVVYNRDATNFVTLLYDSAGSTANSVKITAGKFAVIPDVSRATDLTLTANTAAVICQIVMCGS